MTCPRCGDHGVFKVGYRDGSPTQFAICLCTAGLRMRDDRNAHRHTGSPLWMPWAASHQIPFDRVVMAEDVMDEAELAMVPRQDASAPAASATMIAEAMRTKRAKL